MDTPIATATAVRRVEWVDTDAAGHQHNSAVLRFVEACEAQLFRDLGITSYFGQAPRVRQEINYRAKLWFGQEVTTEVFLDRLGESSMTFSFRVWGEEFQGAPRRVAADGLFVTVCVPSGAEASAPWPAEIRDHLLTAVS
ncbi:thioesterase family protein [uncultured Kocuria sp.]|uniref:acyl-CoA thioesterase n=1 Tax=uncultured Kocuria sp. TaxID=259305 RepID=UPI00262B8386|nr:thioesterase family protein [uncultured Kocuria sp.]